jgi:type II secretion system protein H
MRPNRVQGGFTMVEVMVVCAIMGISLVAALPAFLGYLQSNRVNDTAREMSGRLRLARQSAVAEGIPRIVTWDFEAGSYSIVRDDNEDGVAQNGEPRLGPFTVAEGLTLENKPGESFTVNQVVFTPNGSASQTGTVVVANGAGYALELTVLAPTGQIRLN